MDSARQCAGPYISMVLINWEQRSDLSINHLAKMILDTRLNATELTHEHCPHFWRHNKTVTLGLYLNDGTFNASLCWKY